MTMRCWGLLLGLALLLGARPARAAGDEFNMGASREITAKALGMPTRIDPPDQDGKEVWYYHKAYITFLNGKVVGWRHAAERFPERAPDAPPLQLGSTQAEVYAALGFPPNARRYTGLIVGAKPVGEEEWTYSVGTVIFQDGVVVGWRDVTTPVISLGAPVEKTKKPELGAPAKDVIAARGTPPALTCYARTGDQLWAYADEQYLIRAGKLAWRGVPKPRTAAERPPVRTEPVATDEPAKTEDKGFINDPQFVQFRLAYEPVLQKLRDTNANFASTPGFRAMTDCLNQRPWWAIKGQADINPEYAAGVIAIEKAFVEFLNGRGGIRR